VREHANAAVVVAADAIDFLLKYRIKSKIAREDCRGAAAGGLASMA
jgi:hypothetical protein